MGRLAWVGVLFIIFAISRANAETLRIAVASNFYPALSVIAEEFSGRYGHQVLLSSGASGKHYAQIINGAPFDIFFSADQSKPTLLEQKGYVDSRYHFTYALGQLVLVGQCKSNKSLKECFERNQFQSIALAHPELAPYGKAAYDVMTVLDIAKAAESKLRFGHNVAQAYQFVETHNVELGLVALSLLKQNKKSEHVFWIVPQEYHQPIKQDVVLLKATKARNSSVQFLQFLSQDFSKSVLQKFGYILPGKKFTLSERSKSSVISFNTATKAEVLPDAE